MAAATTTIETCYEANSVYTGYNDIEDMPPFIGMLFTVDFYSDLRIQSLELDVLDEAKFDAQKLQFKVFTMPGEFAELDGLEYKSDPSLWTRVFQGSAQVVPTVQGVLLPAESFSPVEVKAGDTMSFYISMGGPYLDHFANALQKTGEVLNQTADMTIRVGSGLSGLDFPPHIDPIVDPGFAGRMNFEKVAKCNSTSNSLGDSELEDNSSSLSSTMVVYPLILSESIKISDLNLIVQDALEEYLKNTDTFRVFEQDYGLSIPTDTAFTTAQQPAYTGPCPDEFSKCPPILYKTTVSFQHFSSLGSSELLYELYRASSSISSAVQQELPRLQAAYVGPESEATVYDLILYGIPSVQLPDDVQLEFLENRTETFLSNEVDSSLASDFRALLESQSRRTRSVRALQSDDSIRLTGTIFGIRENELSTSKYTETLSSAFDDDGKEAFRSMLANDALGSEALKEGERYKYFESLKGVRVNLTPLDSIASPNASSDGDGTLFLVIAVAVGTVVIAVIVIVICKLRYRNMDKDTASSCGSDEDTSDYDKESPAPSKRTTSFDDSVDSSPTTTDKTSPRQAPPSFLNVSRTEANQISNFAQSPCMSPRPISDRPERETIGVSKTLSWDGVSPCLSPPLMVSPSKGRRPAIPKCANLDGTSEPPHLDSAFPILSPSFRGGKRPTVALRGGSNPDCAATGDRWESGPTTINPVCSPPFSPSHNRSPLLRPGMPRTDAWDAISRSCCTDSAGIPLSPPRRSDATSLSPTKIKKQVVDPHNAVGSLHSRTSSFSQQPSFASPHRQKDVVPRSPSCDGIPVLSPHRSDAVLSSPYEKKKRLVGSQKAIGNLSPTKGSASQKRSDSSPQQQRANVPRSSSWDGCVPLSSPRRSEGVTLSPSKGRKRAGASDKHVSNLSPMKSFTTQEPSCSTPRSMRAEVPRSSSWDGVPLSSPRHPNTTGINATIGRTRPVDFDNPVGILSPKRSPSPTKSSYARSPRHQQRANIPTSACRDAFSTCPPSPSIGGIRCQPMVGSQQVDSSPRKPKRKAPTKPL